MAEKSSGFEYDRQVFVQPEVPNARPAPPIAGTLIIVLVIVVLGVLAYKLLPQFMADTTPSQDASLAEVNQRLSDIETRLDKLEAANKRTALTVRRDESDERKLIESPSKRAPSRFSAEVPQQSREAHPSAAALNAAAEQRLAAVQQGIHALQNNQAADRDAWQATTNKMADMAGQVGTQNVQVLRNRDELNEVLAQTEMEAIPFELYRGANPQPVGPISMSLKSASPKHQRYTLCVYVQNTCTELKNRMLHEVVQVAVSRNSVPLKVVGTKLSSDEMVGYLEVPRDQSGP
jgi:hypothetical protein